MLSLYTAPKHGLNQNTVVDLILCIVVGAIVGGKSLSVLVNLKQYYEGACTKEEIFSGIVIYGGMIAAFIISLIYCKIKKVDFLAYLDLGLPCCAVAQGVGRIGCLAAGCCYGIPYDGIGAITFSHSAFAPNEVSLFPTQIISSVFMLTFGFTLLWLYNHKEYKKGMIGVLYFIIYGLARFFIEFYRGDDVRGHILFFSTSQFISIFIIALGIILYLHYVEPQDAPQN